MYRILAVLLVMCVSTIHAEILRGRSYFSPRSTSTNAARDLAGWQEYINLYVPENPAYGAACVVVEGGRSFDQQRLAKYFFNTNTLVFSGSRSPVGRSPEDILADYFGLPTDFRSVVSFCPTVTTALADFHWYTSFNAWRDDIYFRVHVPVVYTRWNMNMCEYNINPGELNYPAGYMGSGLITRGQMTANVTTAFAGGAVFGDREPLLFGKLHGGRNAVAFSDVQMALGWNVCNKPSYHFGLLLRVTMPAGTPSRAHFLFEPVIGNGDHWEVGLGLTGHTDIWYNNEGTVGWSFYSDLNIMHLFASRQRRSYDLRKGGTLSRYMLIQEIGNPLVQGVAVEDIPIQLQYHGRILPAINQTTLYGNISIAIQADLVGKFTYVNNRWSADFGYNLWARTGESLGCRDAFPSGHYAVKGDAQLYGFVDPEADIVELRNSFVALNATQSNATIHAGQYQGNANLIFDNKNADNVALSSPGSPATFVAQPLNQSTVAGIANTGLLAGDIGPINGSPTPILLDDCDIDNLSALAPSALTNKFFANLRYEFDSVDGKTPFLGLGIEVEIDGGTTCQKADALSQWGIWFRAGLSY